MAPNVKFKSKSSRYNVHNRAVGRSENPEVPVLFGGHNLSPFDIGLTDLPKSWGIMAPLAPPRTKGTVTVFFIFWLLKGLIF